MNKLNKLSWKLSLYNYSSTLIGLIIWGVCVISMLAYFQKIQEQMGALFPLVLVIGFMLITKLTFIIPRPITTYEEILQNQEE